MEVAAPVLDEEIKQRILDLFDTQMKDNVKARDMQPDGKYVRLPAEGAVIDAQTRFFAEAYANVPKPKPKPAPVPAAPVEEAPTVKEEIQIEDTPKTDEQPPVPAEVPVKKKAGGQDSSTSSAVRVKVKKLK